MGQVVMQPGMSPQMTNMQQGIQNTLQHHPNMNASTGVPPTQQMPGRPVMPQMSPHAMQSRNTPMNQSQGTVQQHMVSGMDQGFNVGAPQQTIMGGNTFSHPAAQGAGFNTAGNTFQTNVNQSLGHMSNPNQGSLDGYGKMNDKWCIHWLIDGYMVMGWPRGIRCEANRWSSRSVAGRTLSSRYEV